MLKHPFIFVAIAVLQANRTDFSRTWVGTWQHEAELQRV